MSELSQVQRVMRLAWARENEGICATDFLLPDVADGGKPITRLAARIKDLEGHGIRFTSGGVRNRCKVYVLDRSSLVRATKPPSNSGPPSAVSSPPAADGEPGALFDIGEAKQSAIYDADWAA